MPVLPRLDARFTTPDYDQLLLPGIGLPLAVRYHANALRAALGQAVTSLIDTSGNGRHSSLAGGANPVVEEVSGVRTFRPGVGMLHASPAFIAPGRGRTLFLSGYFPAIPESNLQAVKTEVAATGNARAALVIYGTSGTNDGKWGLYPGAGPAAAMTPTAPAYPGWHTIIGTINDAGTEVKIAVDGIVTKVVSTVSWTPGSFPFTVAGSADQATVGLRYLECGMAVGALTDAQMLAAHTVLAAQFPA